MPLFRARLIGLGFDPERALVLIELREEAVDEDERAAAGLDESEGHSRAALRARARRCAAMARIGAAVVAAGRPPCPLCDWPMDPDGHICPRWN